MGGAPPMIAAELALPVAGGWRVAGEFGYARSGGSRLNAARAPEPAGIAGSSPASDPCSVRPRTMDQEA